MSGGLIQCHVIVIPQRTMIYPPIVGIVYILNYNHTWKLTKCMIDCYGSAGVVKLYYIKELRRFSECPSDEPTSIEINP